VKLGNAEVDVEADSEHFREAIELIPEVAAKLSGVGTQAAAGAKKMSVENQRELSDLHTPGEFPVIVVEKGDSLADVIGKFFSDAWGRERRKLSDVRVALQSYGMNYPKQSVAVALLRLAKATKIRRFKAEDGEFVYTSAVMPQQYNMISSSDARVDQMTSSQNLI